MVEQLLRGQATGRRGTVGVNAVHRQTPVCTSQEDMVRASQVDTVCASQVDTVNTSQVDAQYVRHR